MLYLSLSSSYKSPLSVVYKLIDMGLYVTCSNRIVELEVSTILFK